MGAHLGQILLFTLFLLVFFDLLQINIVEVGLHFKLVDFITASVYKSVPD